MILIKPSFEIMWNSVDVMQMLRSIELYGRTCYKSEDRINSDSAMKFVEMLIKRGHESVLEHEKLTVKFIVDRGVSHELVRHRIASFSQESTRYCDYNKDHITFIIPDWVGVEPGIYNYIDMLEAITSQLWMRSMLNSEAEYKALRTEGIRPEQARSVLPNSLKTEIVVTCNFREWRTIFKQRTSMAAHPQMREVMRPLLDTLKQVMPIMFDDISYALN